MDEPYIESISQYLKFIEDNCTTDNCLFRGQRDNYSLLPKIARVKHRGDLLEMEQQMLIQFKRYSKPYLNKIPINDWEWLSLAQHHGMATRLLDWSLNPLAALWFVVEKPVSNEFGVVWIFDPPEKDIIDPNIETVETPFDGNRTKVFQPDILTNRIQSQLGWFTVHKYIDDHKKFVPLDKNKIYKKCLSKIRIPRKCFSDIRYQLDRLGVNRMSLFPDLDGIACHVEWLKTFYEDEAK